MKQLAFYQKNLHETLNRLITNDYILIGLPDHGNVGDSLIWQATLDILSHKCLHEFHHSDYKKPSIGDDVIIVIHGGGDFGDVWIQEQKLRHRVLEDFPNHKIVQLPQSVYFQDDAFLQEDIERFANHKGDITICLRDQSSYDFITAHYKNCRAYLLPDMAFSLKIKPCKIENGKNVLFVKRHDKESPQSYDGLGLTDCDISDWPTINKPLPSMRFAEFCSKAIIKAGLILHLQEDNLIRLSQWVRRILWHHIIKRQLIKSGISFLSPYKVIYATRLHAGILAYMLGKDVVLVDNPNHKLKNFYDTWFKDVSSVELIELSEYIK